MPHLHLRFLLATVYFVTGGRQLPLLTQLPFAGVIFLTLKMADDDVATKAPESDATEPSMVSSEDTPAQKGASMGVRNVAPSARMQLT